MAEDEKPKENIIVIKKRNLIFVVVAVLIVIGIIIGWGILFPSNSDNLIEYIAADSPVLGSADIYVIEFSDYECPFCQASEGFNDAVMNQLKGSYPGWEAPIPKIVSDYVDSGKVSLVFRQYPLHQDKNPALAAKCAQEQGLFWEYHNMLFENYDALSETDLKRYAIDAGLDANQFSQCLDTKKYQESMENDLSDGRELGVSGTPTFFIGNQEKGYEKVVGAQPFSLFQQIIESKISV